MATNNNLNINQTPTPMSSPRRALPQPPAPKDTPSHQLNPNSAPFLPSAIAMNNIPLVSVSSPANSSYHSAQNDISLSHNCLDNSSSSSGSSLASNGKRHRHRSRRERPSAVSSNGTDGDSQESIPEDDGEEEDSESDVEIYLSTIDLNSSLIDEHPISLSFNSSNSFENTTSNSPNQIFNDHDRNSNPRPSSQNQALSDDSPVLPTSHTFASSSQSAAFSRPSTRASIQSPPPTAPLRQTVPLPNVEHGPEATVPGTAAILTQNDHPSHRPATGSQAIALEAAERTYSASTNDSTSTPSSTAAVTGSTSPTRPASSDTAPKLIVDTKSLMSLSSLDSQSPLEVTSSTDSKSSATSTLGADTRTTNVYINGLPPHYPEEELYKLASQYGAIRSVRTFTRHVRDSESGYGFVLFETIEAAESCIQDLRRYRNLHPTFSKTSHKIPGTYSSADLTLPPSSSGVSLDWQPAASSALNDAARVAEETLLMAPASSITSVPDIIGASSCERRDPPREASFKAKMESLHDPNSTNLYMEGLPLNIDDATLAALVTPHKISSSRFFQTRLSNPPRIIAFVRLETRAGAEEIVERLHGRMVRGWNDSGSRISVRFADTAEQRELRRSERNNTRDADQSPARLTIAQASLLNLHGQGLRTGEKGLSCASSNLSISSLGGSPLPPPPILLDRLAPPSATLQPSRSYGGPNGYDIPYGGYDTGRAHTPPFTVDYTLANGARPISRAHSPGFYPQHQAPPSPYHTTNLLAQQQQLLLQQQQLNLAYQQNHLDPQTLALLDTLRANGSPFQPNHASPIHPGSTRHVGLDNSYQQGNYGATHVGPRLAAQQLAPPSIVSGRGAVQARSGYTATEEYIMRAHLEAQNPRQQSAINYSDASNDNQAVNRILLRNNALRQSQQDYDSSNYDDVQQVQNRRRPPPLDLTYQQRQQQQQILEEDQALRRRDRGDSLSLAGNANISVGLRGYRTQAAILEHHALQQRSEDYMLDEDDRQQSISSLQQALSPTLTNVSASSASSNGHTFQHAHLRSSTLPYRTPSRGQQRHSQTSSMSAAPPSGHGRQNSQSQSQQSQQQYSHGRGQDSISISHNRNMSNSDFDIRDQGAPTAEFRGTVTSSDMNDVTITSPRMGTAEVSKLYLQAQLQQQRRQIRERDQGNLQTTAGGILAAGAYSHDISGSNNTSPSLSIISPALSYSANTPASTLSPATPFFNSFGNSGVQIGGVRDEAGVESNGKGNAVTMSNVQAAFESAKLRNGGQ